MVLTVILFGNELITSSLVAVAFTSLVISELLNVASEVSIATRVSQVYSPAYIW